MGTENNSTRCERGASWVSGAERNAEGKAEGAVTTARQTAKKPVPIMGTSAMNTLRMEFATLQETPPFSARNHGLPQPRRPATRSALPGPPRLRPTQALPAPPPPRGALPLRPPTPPPSRLRGGPPRVAAHARSVFSMMNLTFSSVSSVMRTVGWLAYGMAAPRCRPARPPPQPSRRPRTPPVGREDPPGGPDPPTPLREKQRRGVER